ncbi:hypothetical protein [Thauera aminoaromatica]|uniref:Uncharacterized protein n=1 Tax=Thauera aminoaromatica TaxID=164330 RepID=A0A5C7T6H0_THASP|nr:hypothetical protein [Thauera aminoaromatica]TXH91459.1 MAG: hypothetical protein E6Q80_02675 [Thauera aminoaromatica]
MGTAHPLIESIALCINFATIALGCLLLWKDMKTASMPDFISYGPDWERVAAMPNISSLFGSRIWRFFSHGLTAAQDRGEHAYAGQ